MKKTIFSGIKPTGTLALGNYLGTLKEWKDLQEEYNCVFSVVDLHSITIRIDAAELRENIRNVMMIYMATGIDPNKSIIFNQSHVSAHAELNWVLSCYSYMGELERMTQYKEKAARHVDNINAGLFTYPVLMAADILLYQTDVVPVGDDQKQHLEMARNIAVRFNNIYGDVFKVPEVYSSKLASRIKGLQNPTKKMDKSTDDPKDSIFLLDSPEVIIKKIKGAVTDSENQVRFDVENKPGISNLLTIYATITGKNMADSEKDFEGKSYGFFKDAVSQVVVDELRPLQQEFDRLKQDSSFVDGILKVNAQKANDIASSTLRKVYDKLGL